MSDPEHEQAGHEVRLGHPESEHFRVSFQPFVRHARVGRGTTLLEAARQAGVGLQSVCGGQSTCNLCVVELDPCVELPAPPEEREALNDVGAGPNARLACKVAVDRDLTVSVPACSLTANQRLHLEALGTPVDIQPAVVSREFVIGDWDGQAAGGTGGAGAREAIAASLGEPVLEACEAVLATLAHVVAMSGSKVQAALHGRALVSLSPPGSPLLGVAIDVGTTKLAAYLVSLETGITLAAAGLMNPQITYGEDVMSRVAYASGSPKKAAELQHVVVMKMNRLIEKLCRAAKACVRDIVDVVAVGNTAMHHLLLGLPVAQLGRAPYRPAATAALDVRASELGLEVGEGVWMHTLPNVAGFVGSDHVAMLLSTLGLHPKEVVLGLDVGTNTEITLRTPEAMLCCSCASGPVFEGAHIRNGMRASRGAIERLRIEPSGEVEYQTVGGSPPAGLCGSGVLDAVAQLRLRGILAASGAFRDFAGVVKGPRGKAFMIAPRKVTAHGEVVLFTAEDVGQVQLAKAAIRAGTEILLQEAGIKASEVGRVILAGTFGTYLDPASAIGIGMFLPLPPTRFQQVGNAAGAGARAALLSIRARDEAAELAQRIRYVELMSHPRFPDEFTEALLLDQEEAAHETRARGAQASA